MTSRRECSVVLQRCESAESLRDSKTPNLSEPDSDTSFRSASPAKRRRDSEEMDEGPTVRRGRGHPTTVEEYIAATKVIEASNAQRRKELELTYREMEEEEMAAHRATILDRDLDVSLSGSEEEAAQDIEAGGLHILEIRRRFEESMAAVKEVAKKSHNLKGTYVRNLKEAARVGTECAEALLSRSATDEVYLLAKANKALKVEVKVLRREMEDLRRDMARPAQTAAQAPAPASAPAQPDMEEMLRSVMVQVGTMLNARLAGIEERLLPEKRVRPPLSADIGREARPVPAAHGPKPQEVPEEGQCVSTEVTTAKAHPTVPEEPWTVVVSKNSKRSDKKKSGAVQPVPRPARPTRPKPAKSAKKPLPAKVKVPRLRPPRTAAVVLTLQPEGEEGGLTYAKVIAEAKARIDLGALGVPSGVKMRTAATGAKIIEIPGADKTTLADSLAGKLREVFQDAGIVKISRPVTTADLRVSGLDESIDSTELVAAVAKAGGCSVEEIKAGLIRWGAAGMGTALVRCPVTAAKQVLTRGRLLVGWVSAQVRLLEPRPRKCFKCLMPGHIRAQCKAEVDRSDECYRCGQKGHVANECSAAPHCTTCAAASKPAEHLSGGKACAKSLGKKVQRGKRAVTAAKSQPSQMES